MVKSLCSINRKKITVLGINSIFGRLTSFLLKQSPHVNRLALYDENDVTVACDLSYINTQCKVKAYVGKDQLCCAIKDADIVLIGDHYDAIQYVHHKPDLWDESKLLLEYAKAISSAAPSAVVLVATAPVNSLLPLLTEYLIDHGAYDSNKVLGVTSVDNVRANKFAANHLKLDPKCVILPTVGGSSPDTRVPIFSQARPAFNVSQKVWQTITWNIKNSETLIHREKGRGEAVNKAYATVRFIHSVLAGLRGEPDIAEIALARTILVPGTHYFSLPVILGEQGIEQRFGLPALTKRETLLVEHAANCMNKDVEKGLKYLGKLDKTNCTYVFEESKPKCSFVKKIMKKFSIKNCEETKPEYQLLAKKPEVPISTELKRTNTAVPMPFVDKDDCPCNQPCSSTVLPVSPSRPRKVCPPPPLDCSTGDVDTPFAPVATKEKPCEKRRCLSKINEEPPDENFIPADSCFCKEKCGKGAKPQFPSKQFTEMCESGKPELMEENIYNPTSKKLIPVNKMNYEKPKFKLKTIQKPSCDCKMKQKRDKKLCEKNDKKFQLKAVKPEDQCKKRDKKLCEKNDKKFQLKVVKLPPEDNATKTEGGSSQIKQTSRATERLNSKINSCEEEDKCPKTTSESTESFTCEYCGKRIKCRPGSDSTVCLGCGREVECDSETQSGASSSCTKDKTPGCQSRKFSNKVNSDTRKCEVSNDGTDTKSSGLKHFTLPNRDLLIKKENKNIISKVKDTKQENKKQQKIEEEEEEDDDDDLDENDYDEKLEEKLHSGGKSKKTPIKKPFFPLEMKQQQKPKFSLHRGDPSEPKCESELVKKQNFLFSKFFTFWFPYLSEDSTDPKKLEETVTETTTKENLEKSKESIKPKAQNNKGYGSLFSFLSFQKSPHPTLSKHATKLRDNFPTFVDPLQNNESTVLKDDILKQEVSKKVEKATIIIGKKQPVRKFSFLGRTRQDERKSRKNMLSKKQPFLLRPHHLKYVSDELNKKTTKENFKRTYAAKCPPEYLHTQCAGPEYHFLKEEVFTPDEPSSDIAENPSIKSTEKEEPLNAKPTIKLASAPSVPGKPFPVIANRRPISLHQYQARRKTNQSSIGDVINNPTNCDDCELCKKQASQYNHTQYHTISKINQTTFGVPRNY